MRLGPCYVELHYVTVWETLPLFIGLYAVAQETGPNGVPKKRFPKKV